MTAKDLLDEGKLTPAIELLGGELRAQPNDLRRRILLFELLCFAGDLARAERQLDVIGHQGETPADQLGVQVYRNLLEAEKGRAEVFAGRARPRFMLAPPPIVALHLEALDALREGAVATARAALDKAEALRAPIRGQAGGAPFDDIRDADDVLAPVLEVYAPAGYCWVPWDQIQYLEVPPPAHLRDLLWAPAKIASFDGQLGEVFLPNLYPGSGKHAEESVRLGRVTDWIDAGEGITRGVGQKLLLVGEEGRTLMELGEVQFAPPADAPAAGAAEADEPEPIGGPH